MCRRGELINNRWVIDGWNTLALPEEKARFDDPIELISVGVKNKFIVLHNGNINGGRKKEGCNVGVWTEIRTSKTKGIRSKNWNDREIEKRKKVRVRCMRSFSCHLPSTTRVPPKWLDPLAICGTSLQDLVRGIIAIFDNLSHLRDVFLPQIEALLTKRLDTGNDEVVLGFN